LAEADRAWVEQALADEAAGGAAGGLGRSLEFDRRVAESLEQRLAEVPADVGWADLVRKVRADVAPDPAAARRPAGLDGGGASWRERLSRFVAPLMSPQAGMAMAALVVAQAVVIGTLVGGRDDAGTDTVEYRSGAGAREIVAIRALLHETITEKALREGLRANGATNVDGPDPLGEYWIATGDRDPEKVAAALRDAGIIASYVIDRRVRGR
jgi:hypothetical protein